MSFQERKPRGTYDLGESVHEAAKSSRGTSELVDDLIAVSKEGLKRIARHDELREFRNKFGSPDSESYQLAYEAAQARLPLVADTTRGRQKLKGCYEKAWRNMALRTMETAWLGYDSPPEQKTSREEGIFSRDDRQKVAYVREFLSYLPEVVDWKREEKNADNIRLNMETARQLLTESKPTADYEAGRLSTKAAAAFLKTTVEDKKLRWLARRSAILASLASAAVPDEEKTLLELEDTKITEKMTRADSALVWMESEALSNPNLPLAETYRTTRADLKELKRVMTGELIDVFKNQFVGDITAMEQLKAAFPKIAENARTKILDRFPRLDVSNPTEFQERVQKSIFKARQMLVSWDQINTIQPRAGTEKLFTDRKRLMNVDWKREQLLETPLLQEMENAVARLVQQDLELVSRKRELPQYLEKMVVSAENANRDRWDASIKTKQEAREHAKKKYKKWFFLFDPELWPNAPYVDSEENLAKGLEQSKISPKTDDLGKIQEKIREHLKLDARMELSAMKVGPTTDSEGNKLPAGYKVFLHLYSGRLDSAYPIEMNDLPIPPGEVTSQPIPQDLAERLMTRIPNSADVDRVKHGLKVLFMSQLAHSDLKKAGLELSPQEIEMRIGTLYDELVKIVRLQERYGEISEEGGEEKKEQFSQERLDARMTEVAKYIAIVSEKIQAVSIDASGQISIDENKAKLAADGNLSRVGSLYHKRLTALLSRLDTVADQTRQTMLETLGVKNAVAYFGAVIVTFDSNEFVPDQFLGWLENGQSGGYKPAENGQAPIIVIDAKNSGSLGHELRHHLTALADYLLARDGGLSMKSTYRQTEVAPLFDEPEPSFEKRFQSDKEAYKLILGREITNEDGARIVAQLAYLDEAYASVTTNKPGWLDYSATVYSRRGEGKHWELVGDHKDDGESTKRLLAYLQALKRLEVVKTDPHAILSSDPEAESDFAYVWARLTTARSIQQAERLMNQAWYIMRDKYMGSYDKPDFAERAKILTLGFDIATPNRTTKTRLEKELNDDRLFKTGKINAPLFDRLFQKEPIKPGTNGSDPEGTKGKGRGKRRGRP